MAPSLQGPRGARQGELEPIIDLVNRVFRNGIDQNMATDYPLVFRKANLDNLRVITDGARIVSHLAIAPQHILTQEARLQAGMICAVATDSEYRNQGLATRITQDAQDKMSLDGCGVGLLWTSIPDFYRRTGWEVVGSDGWCYLMDRAQAHRFQSRHKIRPYRGEVDRERLMTLHEGLCGGVARQPSDYRVLYRLPTVRVWVAERSGEIKGYAVVGNAFNKSGVVEWGGSPAALASLLSHLTSDHEERRLQIFVPIWANPMMELLESRGVSHRIPMAKGEGCGEMMVRILSVRRLLEDLLPYLESRWEEEVSGLTFVMEGAGEPVSLARRDGCLKLSEESAAAEICLSARAMARLFFGPETPREGFEFPDEVVDWLDRVFPIPFHIWMLDYV